MKWFRLGCVLAVLALIAQSVATPLAGYRPNVAHAASGPSVGVIPWHPHLAVTFADGLAAGVDLADGHVDVSAADFTTKLVGRPFSLVHTWDSTAAQAGVGTVAGQGWFTGVTPSMSGAPGKHRHLHRCHRRPVGLPLQRWGIQRPAGDALDAHRVGQWLHPDQQPYRRGEQLQQQRTTHPDRR